MRWCLTGVLIVLLAGCGSAPAPGAPATAGIVAAINLAALVVRPDDFPAGYRLYSADTLPPNISMAGFGLDAVTPSGAAAIAMYYSNDAPSYLKASGWVWMSRAANSAVQDAAYANAARIVDDYRLAWYERNPAGLGEQRFMATASLALGSGDYDLAKIVFLRCGTVVVMIHRHPISFASGVGGTPPDPLEYAQSLDRRLLDSPLCTR
jgi:hypothetical protein